MEQACVEVGREEHGVGQAPVQRLEDEQLVVHVVPKDPDRADARASLLALLDVPFDELRREAAQIVELAAAVGAVLRRGAEFELVLAPFADFAAVARVAVLLGTGPRQQSIEAAKVLLAD